MLKAHFIKCEEWFTYVLLTGLVKIRAQFQFHTNVAGKPAFSAFPNTYLTTLSNDLVEHRM